MKVKHRKILLTMCLIGGIVYVIYTYILPMLKPTTFEFDVNDMYLQYKIDYENFYKSSNIISGEKFDIILENLEKVDEVDKGQVRANIIIVGKTNTIYERIIISARFGVTDIEPYKNTTVRCEAYPICNFYSKNYGKEEGWEKYRSDVYRKSQHFLRYKDMDGIGPLRLKFHYDYNQNGDELYNLMKFGYVMIQDQDGKFLDAVPFDFTDIIDNE